MFSIIQSYNVSLKIIQGRELVAKDRHWLTQQRTTSDPYVVAFMGIDKRLGQTKTCDKTLNPVWNSTFSFSVPNKKQQTLPVDMTAHRKQTGDGGEAAAAETILACGIVFLKIYDDDKMTDPDLMGTVVIPIPVPPTKMQDFTVKQWCTIDNLFVPNAKGEIEVEFTVSPVVVSKFATRDWIPSPETCAKWTASCMGKKQAVDENNVVVENEADRRSYVMALVHEMYANRGNDKQKRNAELFEVPLESRLNQDTSSLENWLGKADKSVGQGGFSKLLASF